MFDDIERLGGLLVAFSSAAGHLHLAGKLDNSFHFQD